MLDEMPNPVPDDKEEFPFGLHRGTPIGKVPATYLDFIHGQPWIKSWPRVLAYIEANRKYLDIELEDKIQD
jgi:hypothetical protein